MRKLPPLTALRAFEAAARHASFKQAAAELAVTPTAISHHVRLLEDRFGRRLFDRNAKRVRLTAAGQILFPVLRDSFDAIARGVELVSNTGRERVIVVTATLAFTARWLVPRMAAFRACFPISGCDYLPRTMWSTYAPAQPISPSGSAGARIPVANPTLSCEVRSHPFAAQLSRFAERAI